MALVAAILAVALLVLWFVVRSRMRAMRRRIDALERLSADHERLIRGLTEPVRLEPERAPTVEKLPEVEPVQPVMRPRFTERIANQPWEEMVGADWLNKLGVLVLVIGIALGLAYSFTYMGPWGRVVTALTISGAMLIAGVTVERRHAYAVFGRGLIGGGWAGLYFTTYGMYGLAAAKVINSPIVESILLTAVSAAMIAHALWYRSQTVTLLAYFIGFVTMAITPVTAFSVLALLPLAASVLYLAHRYSWHRMALAGVIATYLVCASRAEPASSLASAQALVAAYWLLFELFVLLRAARGGLFSEAEQWIFPLNTLGATVLSVAKWESAAAGRIWILFAIAAALHVCGSIVRARLRPPKASTELSTLDRALSGGYESAAFVAALYAAVAICVGSPGLWIAPGLLVEGELLFLLALRFHEPFLERLGMAAFGGCIARIFILDAPQAHKFVWFGRTVLSWTPTAVAAAVLWYINRAIRRSGPAYTWAATGALLAVAAADVDYRYIGLLWLIFAGANLEAGLRWRLREFRVAAYASGLLGIAYVALVDVVLAPEPVSPPATIVLSCAAILCYLGAVRLFRAGGDCLRQRERSIARAVASSAGTVFAAALLRVLLPDTFVAAGWSALMLALYWIGLQQGGLRDLSWHAIALASIVFCRAWAVNLIGSTGMSARVLAIGLTVTALYAAQLIAPRSVEAGFWFERYQRAWFSMLASGLLALLLGYEVSGGLLTMAWGLEAVVLLAAGFPLRDRVLRLSALALFFVCIAKLFFYDLRNLETLDRILSFLVLGAIMVAVSWVYTRFRSRIQRYF
jgi:Predicted membrane protein (DUF2339)